jgi:hypothetical protein
MPGVLTAYKEPVGPEVRVDSLRLSWRHAAAAIRTDVRKLIYQSNSTHSLASALDRTLRALVKFHIGGQPAK